MKNGHFIITYVATNKKLVVRYKWCTHIWTPAWGLAMGVKGVYCSMWELRVGSSPR